MDFKKGKKEMNSQQIQIRIWVFKNR